MPLKFRCYRCNQLLGASRSKVGAVISCPKCGSALIVPEADETAAPMARSVKPALGAVAGGSAPGTESILDIRPEDIRVEPGIELIPSSADGEEPAGAPITADTLPELAAPAGPDDEPVGLPGDDKTAPDEADDAPAAVAPPITVNAPRVVDTHEAIVRVRARDVVLPRSVVLAWSLFVLLALALAFGAGLLAGHYVWRVHEPPGRATLR